MNQSDITGKVLNDLYDKSDTKKFRDQTGKDWMSIKVRTTATPFSEEGVGFDKRMILFLDDETVPSANYGTKFYKSAESGISLIIVEDGAGTEQLGNNTLIRGLIINLGEGKLNLQAGGSNMHVKGATYSVGNGAFKVEGGAGKRITFTYDKEVLEEIAALGVFGESSEELELELIPSTIYKGKSTMLSRSF